MGLSTSQKGSGFIQALIGGGLLVGGALLVIQQMSNSMKVQRQTDLRNTRSELTRLYGELSRNPVARTNTINAAYNIALKNHIDGSTPAAGGTWNPPSNIRALELRDQKNNIAVHNDGVVHYKSGELCGSYTPATGCIDAKGSWLVRAQWIAHPNGQYEVRIVVDQNNPVDDIDIALKQGDSTTMATASDNDWDLSNDNVHRTVGNVGVGTVNPNAKLQVTGKVRIAHPTDEVAYYMDIEPESVIAGDVYYHFKIQDSGGLNDSSAMTIRGQDGYIGIGTTNPTSLLHLSASSMPELRVHNTSNDAIARLFAGDDSNVYLLNLINSNGRITVGSNGNVGIGLNGGALPTNKLQVNGSIQSATNIYASAWVTPSDKKLKKNIRKLESVLDLIERLSAYRYELKDNKALDKKERIGVLAQEVQKSFPEVVYKDPQGNLGVDYSRLVAPMVQAVNELHQKLRSSQASEQNLREENADLKRELAHVKDDARKNSQAIKDLSKKIERIEALKP